MLASGDCAELASGDCAVLGRGDCAVLTSGECAEGEYADFATEECGLARAVEPL